MCILISLLIIPVLLILAMPSEISSLYKLNWACASVCLWASLLVLAILNAKKIIDIYSPIVFYMAIYLMIYFVTPLYDIYVGRTLVFGVDLIDYGVKGIIVAFIGFISFCFVYSLKSKKRYVSVNKLYDIPDGIKQQIVTIALIIWVIDFVLGVVIFAFAKGFSFSYVLSFGMIGKADAFLPSSTSLGFIYQFTRSIVTAYLIIYAFSDNATLKNCLFILTALLEISNGFRYMIVIMIFSLLFYRCVSEKKKPKLFEMAGILLIIALVVSIIGMSRSAMRTGNGFSIEGFNLEYIIYTFVSNFEIYKSYYAVIKCVPGLLPFQYLNIIVLYTIIMIIPRAIWPGKPESSVDEPLLYGINDAAYYGGFAYPNLGEYYYALGVFGVILFMGITGFWLAKVENKFRVNATTSLDYVQYSILVPATFQLIIRGYTPGNFYLIIALSIPLWIIKKYIGNRMEY